jgi:membrane-bound serine protease (ClpP class)
MRAIFWIGAVALGVVSAGAATDTVSLITAAEPSKKTVYIIPIRSNIDAPLTYVVRRGVKEAERAHADALVLDMDTHGGTVGAMEDITDILTKFDGESVTFVNTRAYSAGAFIAVTTKHIYMAPSSEIGAAAVIRMMPGTGEVTALPDTYEKKLTSAYAAKIRSTAQLNGYNAAVVEKMVDKEAELSIDGKLVKPKGEILTLTNVEAGQKYGRPPKPLLSSGTVKNMDELLDRIGLAGANVVTVEPTGAETIADWINTFAFALLALGALGLYLEFKLQSFGLIGVAAVACLLLFFFGEYIAGLSGYEYALLFLVGVVLLAVEVFVLPGHLVCGMLGTVFILVAVVMAMVDQYPGGPWLPAIPDLRRPLTHLGLAVALALFMIGIAAKLLPRTSAWDQLALKATSAGEITAPSDDLQPQDLLGKEGVAISFLRPAGKAMFGGQLADVVTEGDLIPKDARVKVIKVEGNRVVVTKV